MRNRQPSILVEAILHILFPPIVVVATASLTVVSLPPLLLRITTIIARTPSPLKLYSPIYLSACLSTKIIWARGKQFQSVCLSFSPCLSVSARATNRRTATNNARKQAFSSDQGRTNNNNNNRQRRQQRQTKNQSQQQTMVVTTTITTTTMMMTKTTTRTHTHTHSLSLSDTIIDKTHCNIIDLICYFTTTITFVHRT